jgi:sugar phosphate isomerase/epimerase
MDETSCIARLGFPTYLWWGMPDVLEPRIPFDEALRKVEAFGFRHTDIYLVRKDLYDPDVRDILERSFRESDVQLATIAGEAKPFGTFDDEVQERIAGDLSEEIRLAARLGAKNVGIRTDTLVPERHTEQIERLAGVLAEVVPLCNELNVNITIESHSNQVATRTEDQIEVHDMVGSPRVGVCLDVSWAYASGMDPAAAIRELGDLVLHVHLRDARRAAPLVLPGEGEVDFVEVFRALRDIGYAGPLVLELEKHCFMDYSKPIEDGIRHYRDMMIDLWRQSS